MLGARTGSEEFEQCARACLRPLLTHCFSSLLGASPWASPLPGPPRPSLSTGGSGAGFVGPWIQEGNLGKTSGEASWLVW